MSKPLGKMGSFVTPFQNFVPLFLLLLLPFSATLCHAQTCPGLTFSSVTPTPWVAGQTYNKVVITGTGLNGPDNSSLCNRFNFGVSLTNGGTATLSDVSYVSAKKITATVTLPASDTAQTACVTADYWEADVIRKTANVRKEASVSSDACAWTSPYFGAIAWFAVPVYPTLTVTSVTPDGWWATKKQDITITGTGFFMESDPGGPSKVTVTDGAHAVTLSNTVVVSSTQITASVDVSKDAPNAPAETATLTVTNPPTGGKPQSATANPPPVILPVPVIKWLKNKTISGDNPQIKNPKIKVGQPVELTTLPASLPGSFTITKSTWNVPGDDVIKSYNGDDGGITIDDNVDLKDLNTTFYWLYPDTGLNVTYEYCATDPNGNQICTSPQASAAFEATGGGNSVSMSTDDSKIASIENLYTCDDKGKATNHTAPWMGYGDEEYAPGVCSGNVFIGKPGIIFTASGANSGKYVFVQLIDSDVTTLTYPTGASIPVPGLDGLDKNYPYPSMQNHPNQASDGPNTGLPDLYSTVGRAFKATMYLLWQPDPLTSATAPSIPVPIAYQVWQFDASTNQIKPGKWQDPPNMTGHGDVGKFQHSTVNDPNTSYGYPQW